MKTVYKIVIGLITALGFLHSGLTFFLGTDFSARSLWFFGTGLGLVMLGFLNVANLRHGANDRIIWRLSLCANSIFLTFFAVAVFIIPEPQIFVGIAVSATALVLAFLIAKK